MKKAKIFGKSIPVLAIVAIVASAGLVSAALLSYYGKITTTAKVQQSVVVDDQNYLNPITETINTVGGNTVVTTHSLTNRSEVPATVNVETSYWPDGEGITVTYTTPPEKVTPIIDGELDDGYNLVATDTETESGVLPINVYAACDDDYMYWFFESTNPTDLEQGIGNTNLLFDTDGDGVWNDEIVYIQEIVYDGDFVEVPGSQLARDISGSPEIGYTLEVAIPRADERYACHPWVYDVWSLGSPARNTAWGDTSYWTLLYPTELPEGDPIMVVPWLDCPCEPEELIQPITLQPGETLDFYICYSFDVNIVPGTYTITTTVEPQ